MSTYYAFRNPMSEKDLETIGLKIDEGWIVDNDNENAISIEDTYGEIYGFTRYGSSDPEFLLDILDENGIDWCDEYDLNDLGVPTYDIAEHYGVDTEDENLYDLLQDFVYGEWYAADYYWSEDKDEFIKEWCEKNKELFQEVIK
jgi:hypothetical protein